MDDSIAGGAYGSLNSILGAIDRERRRVWEQATAETRQIESQRDSLLDRLDRAVEELEGSAPERSPDQSREAAKRPARRRRRSRSSGTPEDVRERCEAIFRYLSEDDFSAAMGQLCEALAISRHSARTALERLEKEGRIEREGGGPHTRYRAKGGGAKGIRAMLSVRETTGTLPGRIMEVVLDRGHATLDELVQATKAPREEVLKACGALVREEEMRMGRRHGRPVYIVLGVA